jgi:hypothetical protein
MLLLQQNQKYKNVHILAYSPCLDMAVKPNGKSGPVLGNNMDHSQVAD